MTVSIETSANHQVSDASDAELYAGFVGSGNVVLARPLELTLSNANTLQVGEGTLLQNGRHIRLKGETEFTIPTGIQAQKRSNIALIRTTIARDDSNMSTTVTSVPMVLSGEATATGTPTDPELITGNLLEGDTVADFPIARVITDGINALDPEPLYVVQPSAKDSWDSISQVSEINQDGVRIVVGHGVATVSVTKTVSAPVWSTTRIATVPEPYRPKYNVGCIFLYVINNTFTAVPASVYPDGGIAVSVYNEPINGEIYGSVTYPVAQTA